MAGLRSVLAPGTPAQTKLSLHKGTRRFLGDSLLVPILSVTQLLPRDMMLSQGGHVRGTVLFTERQLTLLREGFERS